ncbi:MAG: hypothetical protein HY060_26565 [Proteobacteria bacterium]|nr:hypothetical protein [Pseudomonadota bacterium]
MATMVQERPSNAAAEAQAKRRQQWLERVGKELVAAEGAEPQSPAEPLAKRLDQMLEVAAKADVLEPRDKSEIRERVHAVKLRLYERHVAYLLDETMAATRDRARKDEKSELLKQINTALAAALRLGLSSEIRDSVKQRLAIIHETSAAGESAKAKEDAEREARRRESGHPNERRTFTRWHEPPLVVVIGNRRFTTADWSLSGILIDEFDAEGRQPGEQLDIQIGLESGRLYKERVEIVRHSAEPRRVAIKSRRFASVLMQVKRDCDAQQLEPC